MKRHFFIFLGLICGHLIYGQLVNDSCNSPTLLTFSGSGNICQPGSNVGASSSGITYSCISRPINEVWYSFHVFEPNNKIVVRPAGSKPGKKPVLVAMSNCGFSNIISCDTAASNNDSATVQVSASINDTILIGISFLSGEGEFELCINSNAIDFTLEGNTCDNAIRLCNKSTITLDSTDNITSSGYKPSCFKQVANKDVWFSFKAAETGSLEWKASPLGKETELDWALYDITGGCPISSDSLDVIAKELGCNYNFAGEHSDPVGMSIESNTDCPTNKVTGMPKPEFCPSIEVQKGRTYVIMIDNFNGNNDGFELSWGGSFEMDTTHGCRQIRSDSIIWPGDANSDLVANYLDILPIGLGYGESGFQRIDKSTDWYEHDAPAWSKSFLHWGNYNNADCDGNGTIDENDINAIIKNYGSVANKTTGENGGPGDPPLYPEFQQDSIMAGSKIRVPVFFGTSNIPAKDVYGVAFAVNYNHLLVENDSSFTMDITGSWLGKASQLLTVQKNFPQSGRIEIGITRMDKMNTSGKGFIGELSFVMEENLAGKKIIRDTIILYISDVTVISNDEAFVPVNAGSDTLMIFDESTLTQPWTMPEANVLVFPNPARNEINITASEAMEEISLYDMTGRIVDQYQPNKKHIWINTDKLNAGIYIFGITAGNKQIMKRIIISK